MPIPYITKTTLQKMLNKIKDKKQDKLASGTNIKTINNVSLLGNGNIDTSNANTVDGFHIQQITQAQYDALSSKNANTIYLIKG